MSPKALRYTALAAALMLGGCAMSPSSEQALDAARSSFDQVREDADVLRSAPKDLIRAGESLARADRLSNYWGSSDDVAHYAYLSQQYSAIARQKSAQLLNQERSAKLELDKQRLQLALREAKLLSVQGQGQWLEEQIVSLTRDQDGRGMVMTLGDVVFDPDQSDLKPAANRTVLKVVQFLQLNGRRTVRIEGYTDNLGKLEDNLKLSQARAQAVADVLVDLGIDPKRIQVQGYGDSFPVAENASQMGRSQNRRVEIVFSDDQGRLGSPR